MRRSLAVCIVFGAGCLTGCDRGDNIWVTGVLQKGGQSYKPAEGRKLSLYFHPIADERPGGPAREVEMADYIENDGSFSVPGREGHGIPPGKYRVAVVETLRREALDQLKKATKPKRGEKRIDKETNFLEDSFGEKTSPFVLDLQTSIKLTLDMAKPPQ